MSIIVKIIRKILIFKSADNWKPATKTDQVIQSLVALVNDPEPEHPLRGDLAEGR